MKNTIALLVLALASPSCGGGGTGDSGGVVGVNDGELSFDSPQPVAHVPSYSLTGNVYGLADPPGNTVTWTNATKESAGVGGDQMVEVTNWFFGYEWTSIVHKWTAAVDLVPGANTITVTVTDRNGIVATDTVTVTYAPPLPEVHITAPWDGSFWNTTESPLTMSGVASADLGLSAVTWTNELTGVTGTATGTALWTAPVPLGLGANPIRITATDALGGTASKSLTVTYPAANPAPTVTVTGPGTASSGSLTVASDSVLLEGTASSVFGIARMAFETLGSPYAGGQSDQAAPEQTAWTYFTWLSPGAQTVRITAVDTAGQTAVTEVVVTRN